MSNNITTEINQALQQALPDVNQLLPGLIDAANLDPVSQVAEGSWSPGKYLDCTVTVGYDITDLDGLNTAQIESLAVDSAAPGSQTSFDVQATIQVDTGSLTADWSGSASVDTPLKNISEGVSGNINASVSASGNATVACSVSSTGLTVDSVQVSSLTLTTSDPNPTVNGLGDLQFLADDVAKYLLGVFNPYIDEQLAPAVEGQINKALAKAFPQSISI